MKTLAIIQARTNSTRLDKKILRDIYAGYTSLDYILATLKKVERLDGIVIATSTSPSDDELVNKYQDNYNVHRGDEHDVLARFCSVIQTYKPDHIVRVVSDNPFMPFEPIDALIRSHIDSNYSSYTLSGINTMLCSLGLFVEVVAAKALLQLNARLEKNHPYREHVTLAIYKDKSNQEINYLEADDAYVKAHNQGVRLTLDTPEDLSTLRFIARKFKLEPGVSEASIHSVIRSRYISNIVKHMKAESGKAKNSKAYRT